MSSQELQKTLDALGHGITDRGIRHRLQKLEKNNARRRKKQGDIYEDTVSTYRIFSRAFCNFVFPNELDEEEEIMITRPMPRDGSSIEDAVSTKKKKKNKEDGTTEKNEGPVTEELFDAIPIEQQLQNIDGLTQNEDVTNIKKIEKQQTDTSYRDRIQKALTLLFFPLKTI